MFKIKSHYDPSNLRGLKRRKFNINKFNSTSLSNLKNLHSLNKDFNPVRLRKLPPLKKIEKLDISKLMTLRAQKKGSNTVRGYRTKSKNPMYASLSNSRIL